MQHNKIFIDVFDCRAVVSKYQRLDNNDLTWIPAKNAEDLESEAKNEVETWNMSGHYDCSDELAQKAVFD